MLFWLQHVLVQRLGIYYVVDVFDVDGQPLTAQSWEKQIQWIMDDADSYKGASFLASYMCKAPHTFMATCHPLIHNGHNALTV